MNQKNLKFQKFFKTDARGTTVTNEVKSGITTAFISMFVILSSVQIILKSTGMTENQLLIPLLSVSLVISALLTITGGLFAKLPLIFLSTIGFNLFITNQVISALSLDWGIGLGLIVIESFLFAILSVSPLVDKFNKELPEYLKKSLPMATGGILILFSLLVGKIISFRGSGAISLLTFRNSPLILFLIGFTAIYFLIREKASFAILQGFLLTLLLGMIIPNSAQGLAFYSPLFIVCGFFIVWMLLYSILVDKHIKKSLELSLWITMIGLLVVVILNSPLDPIISKPIHWFGKLGIINLPIFKGATSILGYPIFNLKSVLNNLPKLIVPILSLLSVHWITYYSFVEILNGYMHYKKKEQENYFSKRTIATEGAIGLLGSSSGGGFFSSHLGSIFSLLLGSKTALASISAGFTFILFLFFIPLFTTSFVGIAFAPILFYFGIKLIVDFLPTVFEDKAHWIPILITLLLSTVTLNIFVGFFAGLLSFIFVKISSAKMNEISNFTWLLTFTLLVWCFFKIPIYFIGL